MQGKCNNERRGTNCSFPHPNMCFCFTRQGNKGCNKGASCQYAHVVVVCPLQPSSSVNSGCPGPESSVLVSSRWACPISSQVTGHWGELCNRTGEVHHVDPFHSLDILKNHFASVAFCRNSGDYNVQNGAVYSCPLSSL